jgi:hypothetical protein
MTKPANGDIGVKPKKNWSAEGKRATIPAQAGPNRPK